MQMYEGISKSLNLRVHEVLRDIIQCGLFTTEQEIQYMFLTSLQALPLTADQVFHVYTNTDL